MDLVNSPAAASPLPVPPTEGIKYAGSKLKLIPFIFACLEGYRFSTVLDGFSGTTRVAQAFARHGMAVTANDTSVWSEVFANCYLKSVRSDDFFRGILDRLNALPGQSGWFSEHYGGTPEEAKKPFRLHNAMKLDAIRPEIESLKLPFPEKCVLLTSLIYALDEVDSTIGHFCSYLAKWSSRSERKMVMRLPRRFDTDPEMHEVVRGDVFDVITRKHYDLAYFDPPYGSNNEKMPPSRVRYEAYYHFWKTVILDDRPRLFGKAGRREDSRDTVASSVFEEFRKNGSGKYLAIEALDRLIREVDADYVLLSYSSGGRAAKRDLLDALSSNGKIVRFMETDYKKNVMAGMTSTNEWIAEDTGNREYLFLLKK